MSLPREVDDDEGGGWFDLWEGHRQPKAMHRVLGHSLGDTEGVDDAEEIVLLALGSDPSAKMEWGDAGVLYFCMSRVDLARRAWDRVRVVSTD